MAENKDIRWLQRYDSFHRACKRVLDITESDKKPKDLNDLEMEGLIQRFEYTFELAWKVLQDYLVFKGFLFQPGPNTTLKMAFEAGLISNHDAWRRMAKARNTTAHTYNEGDAENIVTQIYIEFAKLLKALDAKLNDEKKNVDPENIFI